jgi:DNA-binding winged helix-turn-helix (wHTH) protein
MQPCPRWWSSADSGSWPTAGRQGSAASPSIDVLTALIAASGAVVGKDELLSRVRQGRIVDQDRQSGTR